VSDFSIKGRHIFIYVHVHTSIYIILHSIHANCYTGSKLLLSEAHETVTAYISSVTRFLFSCGKHLQWQNYVS